MKVSFSFGPKSTEPLVNTLQKMSDNTEFFSYKNISVMIKEAELRHIYFDRIIFSEKIISNPKRELTQLNEYIKNNSDSTEIVMVSNPKKSKAASLFLEIFNSPLYTPVILERPTPSVLLEILQEDILALKTKYYVLDVKKQQSVVVQNTDTVEKKKGIFGNKKQKGQVSANAEEPTPEVTESASDNQEEVVSPEVPPVTGFGGGFGIQETGFPEEPQLNFGSAESSPVTAGGDSLGAENEESESDDDELSIGDFGSQHSDTGFLDEDAEAELQAAVSGGGLSSTSQLGEVTMTPPIEETPKPSPREPIGVKPTSAPQQPKMRLPKIFLFTGEKGAGVTQTVVDKAAELVSKGKSVLVIDLDSNSNGVLALIDTPKFYSRKCQNGISNQIIYSEDGVDFLSQGFGGKITPEMIDSAVDRVGSQYACVLIDCPAECLSLVSLELLYKAAVAVLVRGERYSLISTSLALTNRSQVSLEAERYIMSTCKVLISDEHNEYFQEDLGYVKSIALLPNGNWLNNIA